MTDTSPREEMGYHAEERSYDWRIHEHGKKIDIDVQ